MLVFVEHRGPVTMEGIAALRGDLAGVLDERHPSLVFNASAVPIGEVTPESVVSVCSDRIAVQHLGTPTVPEIEASRRDVAEIARAWGLSLVLLDLSRAEPTWTRTSDILKLCVGQKVVLPARVGVAVVYRRDPFSRRDTLFAEAVSLRQGVRLRTFTDLEAAHRWLSERST